MTKTKGIKMEKALLYAAIMFVFFAYSGAVTAQEKRLGQRFIDAYSAKDEDAMRLIIQENKDGVPQEVKSMLAYAVEQKAGWMIEVCNKMAMLYKDVSGDSSLLAMVEKAKEMAFGEDIKLVKLRDEVTAVGKGSWNVTIMEYNDKVLKLEISVDPEVGAEIAKKDVEQVRKTIEKLLPEAYGKVTWQSFGIGVASLVRENGSEPWRTRR